MSNCRLICDMEIFVAAMAKPASASASIEEADE